jgi:hypothetical protein
MAEQDRIKMILDSALRVNEEKRKSTRFDMQAKVTMHLNGAILEGDLVNLSMHGAFVKTASRIEINSSVIVTIFDTPTSRIISDVKAKVVRLMDGGIALRFE